MGLSSPRSLPRAMAAEPAEDPGPDPCVPASRRPPPACPAQHAFFASAPKTLATCRGTDHPARPAHVRNKPRDVRPGEFGRVTLETVYYISRIGQLLNGLWSPWRSWHRRRL